MKLEKNTCLINRNKLFIDWCGLKIKIKLEN